MDNSVAVSASSARESKDAKKRRLQSHSLNMMKRKRDAQTPNATSSTIQAAPIIINPAPALAVPPTSAELEQLKQEIAALKNSAALKVF